MKKIYLSILLLTSLTAPSHAQMRFGIEGGVNMTSVSISNGAAVGGASVEYKTTPDIGFHAGALMDFGLSDNFGVQVGAYYTMIAYKYKYTFSYPGTSSSTEFDIAVAENFVRVPVSLVYRTPVGGGSLFVIGGGFLGYGINGTMKAAGVSNSFSFTDNGGSAISYGAGGGLGYELGMGLFIRAGYEMTLGSVKSGVVGSVTDNVMSVSIGYMFGGSGSSGGRKGGKWGNRSALNIPEYKSSHKRPWNILANP